MREEQPSERPSTVNQPLPRTTRFTPTNACRSDMAMKPRVENVGLIHHERVLGLNRVEVANNESRIEEMSTVASTFGLGCTERGLAV